MTTLFIADLHLDESRPDILDIFLQFLRTEARHADALYILGDLFEAWIGDDNSTFNQTIIQALGETSRHGTMLYFMKGNRDFLIGRKFLRASGCQLLPDEHQVLLGEQPTLLMHGDTLCTEDLKYLQFRKRTRNFFVQQFFLLKPLSQRKALAQKARHMSYDHTRTVSPELMDVTPAEVLRVMHKHQVQHLIHGHTHRPTVHHFSLDGKTASRTVLAPWHDNGSALLCHSDGKQEFIEF
jgi:UDP-2,3-diacylglucosamine hydrolase